MALPQPGLVEHSQVFRDASHKDKEVYFGLKREYMDYDDVFSNVIAQVRTELAQRDTPPPSFMIMRPSSQLKKMITDPPRNALYPAQNLDGDIFSDISAALGGSLATASSIIESAGDRRIYSSGFIKSSKNSTPFYPRTQIHANRLKNKSWIRASRKAVRLML